MDNLSNLQAEQSVLGAVLLDNIVFYKAKETNLKPSDFSQDAHKLIFQVMKKLIQEDKVADVITVSSELTSIGKLNKVGGISYLTSLVTIVPMTSNAAYYIAIVKEFSIKRKVVEKMSDAINDISRIDIQEIPSLVDEIKSITDDSKTVEDLFVDASSIKRNKNNKSIRTGFVPLDALTSGLVYGTLSVLTGNPSTGKSTMLNQVIANALKTNEKAFIYSGELPSYQLMSWFTRTVANEEHLATFKNSINQEYKDVTDYGYDLITKWCKDKFYIYGEDSRANEKNLVNTIEYLATKKGVRLFIFDNLMTIDSEGKDKYENQEIVAKSLKAIAKKYGLVIILVAHPNKESAARKTPSMFDVSGASEVVNLADYVFKTVRKQDIQGNECNSILILKNRITGNQKVEVKTHFDINRKRFCTNSMNEIDIDFGYDANKKFEQVSMNEDPF